MAEERVQRRLAAIVAADVTGYSRLMGADEEGTLAQLKAHRSDLVDPKIRDHQGRIVKTTGDGMLVEFASVSMPCAPRSTFSSVWSTAMPMYGWRSESNSALA